MGEIGNPANIQTVQNPSITYTFAGSKVVSLAVTNEVGSSSTTRTVIVTSTVPPPGSSFSISGARIVNQGLTFSHTPSPNPPANPTGFLYDFGNGVTNSLGPTVSYAYPQTGTYTASLTVTNLGGRSKTTQTLTIGVAPLTVSFTTTPAFTIATRTLTIAVGASVGCTNTTASAAGINFVWSYGGGAWGSYPSKSTVGSTAPTATVYNVPGTYTLSLTGTNPTSGATGSSSITVVVNATRAPTANFSMTIPSSRTPTTVVTTVNKGVTFKLNQLSTNGAAVFLWNYAGAVDAVTGQAVPVNLREPPLLKFPDTSSGTSAIITLRASNSFNTATPSVKSITYTLRQPLPTINWFMSNSVYQFTASINPVNNSTVSEWDFKDGSPILKGTTTVRSFRRGFYRASTTAGEFRPTIKVTASATDTVPVSFTIGSDLTAPAPVTPTLTLAPNIVIPSAAQTDAVEARQAQRQERLALRTAKRPASEGEGQVLPRYTGTVSFTAARVADTTTAYPRQFWCTVSSSVNAGTLTYAWRCTKVGTTTSVTAAVQNPVIVLTSSGQWSCALTVTSSTLGARTVTGVITVP